MESSVDQPISTKEKIKSSMGPGCPSFTSREETIVIIISFYGARVILPLFCAHQITESEY